MILSTQLIECGVDLSLPKVVRHIPETESLIQSSGRCNREEFSEIKIPKKEV